MSKNHDKSDMMSSVSNSSKFSVKSQQVIAEQDVVIAKQDDQIARMKRMLTEAGIDPYCISPTQKLSWCTVSRDSQSKETIINRNMKSIKHES